MHKLLTLISLLVFPTAFACNPAEGTGQCGYYDNNGTYHNRPRGYYPDETTSVPKNIIIRLSDKYGAVATSKNSKLVSSYAMDSMRKAKQEALSKCEQVGGVGCKIAFSAYNSCISSAQGYYDNGMSKVFFSSRTNKGEAESAALQQCYKHGGFTKCDILLPEECSLPTLPN